MAEEARHLEPVRFFDDEGDVDAQIQDFSPRPQLLSNDEGRDTEVTAGPSGSIGHSMNMPGYDPEHGTWVGKKPTGLDGLVHPLDAEPGQEPSENEVIIFPPPQPEPTEADQQFLKLTETAPDPKAEAVAKD